jgi:Icc-related predicted phosphoesterase
MINITRSDGRAHDLSALAALAQYNCTSTKARTPSPQPGGAIVPADHHEHDAPIALSRSDGIHHDLVSLLKLPTLELSEVGLAKSVDCGSITARDSSASSTTLRIVHMSDTRNFLVRDGKFVTKFLPEGDILVHSGNFTNTGSDEDYANFNAWLAAVSGTYMYRICVPGSRDVKRLGSRWSEIKKRLSNATHVLCHEEANVLGLRIYGCPWFWGNKFNYSVRLGFSFGQEEGSRFSDIPEGIHILVSHGAALGRLDAIYTVGAGKRQHIGSEELLNAVARAKPLVHLFGHCSDSRGYIPGLGRSPLCVNSTMCDKDYKVLFGCPHVIKASELFGVPPPSQTNGELSQRGSFTNIFSALPSSQTNGEVSQRGSFTGRTGSPPLASSPTSSARKLPINMSNRNIIQPYWTFEIDSYV